MGLELLRRSPAGLPSTQVYTTSTGSVAESRSGVGVSAASGAGEVTHQLHHDEDRTRTTTYTAMRDAAPGPARRNAPPIATPKT